MINDARGIAVLFGCGLFFAAIAVLPYAILAAHVAARIAVVK